MQKIVRSINKLVQGIILKSQLCNHVLRAVEIVYMHITIPSPIEGARTFLPIVYREEYLSHDWNETWRIY